MQWISQNWVWILFFVAFVAMHMFGHGGHGGHGGHRSPGGGNAANQNAVLPDRVGARGPGAQAPEHRH